MRYTIPSLVFSLYRLAQRSLKRVTEEDEKRRPSSDSGSENTTPSGQLEGPPKIPPLKLYQIAYQAIESISQAHPETAVRLYLHGVLSMNNVVSSGTDCEELGYQFASQALVLYQDEITDTDAKYRAITFIIGTLQKAIFFSFDNFETLTTNTVQYCAKLLKKQDQCKAILMCTHLFMSKILVYIRLTFNRTIQIE
jgi:hypothetical protein